MLRLNVQQRCRWISVTSNCFNLSLKQLSCLMLAWAMAACYYKRGYKVKKICSFLAGNSERKNLEILTRFLENCKSKMKKKTSKQAGEKSFNKKKKQRNAECCHNFWTASRSRESCNTNSFCASFFEHVNHFSCYSNFLL